MLEGLSSLTIGVLYHKVSFITGCPLLGGVVQTRSNLSRFMELGAVADHGHEDLDEVRVRAHGRCDGERPRLQNWNQVKQVPERNLRGSVWKIVKHLGEFDTPISKRFK